MIIPNSVLLLKSQSAEDGQDKFETILTTNNFEVRHVKTLIFNFKNIDKLTEILNISLEYSGLILSSPRCVQAVYMTCSNNDILEPWKRKDNFVVGEATYKAALDKLGIECIGKESGNALNLSRVILDRKKQDSARYSKPFFLPHGNLKSDRLNLELEKEEVQIKGLEVYDTISNYNIETELQNATDNFQAISEYVVFFSPSGFATALPYLQKVTADMNIVKFIAIGPVTEMAIKEAGFMVYGAAKRPNPEDLLKAILS